LDVKWSRCRNIHSRVEHLLVDPDVWVIEGDAEVVAAVVGVDSNDVAVETPMGDMLELEALPSAAAHILDSPCRPAVIFERMLLSEPHFEEEHWTAVFPPASRFPSIAVQTHFRSDSLVLEDASLVHEFPTLLE
jgi:hypothetical protein